MMSGTRRRRRRRLHGNATDRLGVDDGIGAGGGSDVFLVVRVVEVVGERGPPDLSPARRCVGDRLLVSGQYRKMRDDSATHRSITGHVLANRQGEQPTEDDGVEQPTEPEECDECFDLAARRVGDEVDPWKGGFDNGRRRR
jgi:hypothetical protein